MRYCLSCYRLSASSDGTFCTNCAKSFGGRLCDSRRRHLNPFDANVCGTCSSPNLTDPAAYIPLSWLIRLLKGIVFLVLMWLIGRFVLMPILGIVGVNHYRSPLVWFFETCGRVVVPMVSITVVLYGLSAFLPGEAGKSMRRAIDSVVRWLVRGSLRNIQHFISSLAKLLFGWMSGGTTR